MGDRQGECGRGVLVMEAMVGEAADLGMFYMSGSSAERLNS